MRNLNSKTWTAFAVLWLMLNCAVYGDKPAEIEISTQQTSIRVGEPLVIKLTYRWQKPLVRLGTNKVLSKIEHHAYLNIRGKDEGSSISGYPIFPAELELEGMEGLEYEGHFIVFYDHDKNKIMFAHAGTYTIRVEGWTKSSNALNIEVKPPSTSEKRALDLLAKPNDYHFLVSGELEESDNGRRVLADIEEVIGKCKETVLAKWCAGRLGLHYFRAFYKKYPSFRTFEADQHQAEMEDPLFEQAHKYVALAVGVPDEFAIREDVLYYAIRAEIANANYHKALSYVNELARKYPKGKYSTAISRIKQQILEHKSHEMAQTPQVKLEQKQWSGLLAIIVPLVVGVFVVALVLVLWLKKNRSSCSK
ncbi:MAG: hypothetical protein JRI81_13530 [Deltaproteobacteria bacterium]|nr:hypothetical protein [Deltaproteobacteria bacterium]